MESCLTLDMSFCRTETEQAVNAGSPFSPRFVSTADDMLVVLVTTLGAPTLICSPLMGYRFSIIDSPLINSFHTVKKIFLEHLLQRFPITERKNPHSSSWAHSPLRCEFCSSCCSSVTFYRPRAFQTPCLWDRKCSLPWLCLYIRSPQPPASLIPNLIPTLYSLCLPPQMSLTSHHRCLSTLPNSVLWEARTISFATHPPEQHGKNLV